MQPDAVECVLDSYRSCGTEFSFIQGLDMALCEYDEDFIIPLKLGAQPFLILSISVARGKLSS